MTTFILIVSFNAVDQISSFQLHITSTAQKRQDAPELDEEFDIELRSFSRWSVSLPLLFSASYQFLPIQWSSEARLWQQINWVDLISRLIQTFFSELWVFDFYKIIMDKFFPFFNQSVKTQGGNDLRIFVLLS